MTVRKLIQAKVTALTTHKAFGAQISLPWAPGNVDLLCSVITTITNLPGNTQCVMIPNRLSVKHRHVLKVRIISIMLIVFGNGYNGYNISAFYVVYFFYRLVLAHIWTYNVEIFTNCNNENIDIVIEALIPTRIHSFEI